MHKWDQAQYYADFTDLKFQFYGDAITPPPSAIDYTMRNVTVNATSYYNISNNTVNSNSNLNCSFNATVYATTNATVTWFKKDYSTGIWSNIATYNAIINNISNNTWVTNATVTEPLINNDLWLCQVRLISTNLTATYYNSSVVQVYVPNQQWSFINEHQYPQTPKIYSDANITFYINLHI